MGIFDFLKKDTQPKRAAIIDIGDDDFETQVIRRSYKTPVMVDFWASWCGPCRQLGPTLERIAEDPESDFILAKLNTEQNQRVPGQYGIRSIPAVKMFRNGQVVGEFVGARPAVLVRRFIEKSTDGPPPPPQMNGSSSPAARLRQATQHLKKGRGFEAFVLLDQIPAGPEAEQAEQLRPLARFLFDVEDGDALTGLDALDEAYRGAAQALRRRKPARALEHLFTALDVGEKMDRETTTAVIEGVFALLGENHRLTQQYREERE